jgi:hypothetical protein
VRVQDRLHDVLEPAPLPDELVAAGHLPAQGERPLVRDPDLGQEATGIELRQNDRVDPVGLDLGVRDQAHLFGVGHDHTADVWPQHLGHGCSVAGRFDHNVVVRGQRAGEPRQPVPLEIDPAEPDQASVLERRRFGEHPVNVQTDDPHPLLPWLVTTGAGGQHDTYRSALTAHPGESQGRPCNERELTAHGPIGGLPAPCVLPVPHVPDGRTIAGDRSAPQVIGHRRHHAG